MRRENRENKDWTITLAGGCYIRMSVQLCFAIVIYSAISIGYRKNDWRKESRVSAEKRSLQSSSGHSIYFRATSSKLLFGIARRHLLERERRFSMTEIPRRTRWRTEITSEISRDNGADKYRKIIFIALFMKSRSSETETRALTKRISFQR